MPLYNVENTVNANPRFTATVFLDGIEVDGCIEADTDVGYVVRVKRDDAGFIITDGGEIAMERLEGVVTVNLHG